LSLADRGAGKKLAVKRSSFDACLGRAPTVYPRWAGNYLLLPDDRDDRQGTARPTAVRWST
jgi:hypothetical protein